MRLPFGLTPPRFLRWSLVAAIVSNLFIIFSGGIVRVTGSGLGCPDWPTCEGTAIAPTGAEHAGWQAFIEFGNRLLTFLVLATVIAVYIAIRITRPHAKSVNLLAILLVGGVLAQAVAGGITVWTGLRPEMVAVHFLLSMFLVAFAMILYEFTRDRMDLPVDNHKPASRGVQHATTAILIVGAAVLFLGTMVTGSGPHGGDPDAPRLPFDIRTAAITHADAVWMLVGITTATVLMTWRNASARFRRAIRLLLIVQLAQGGIGYAQYALGIPEALVSLHIVGAALMWAVACAAWARARPRPDVAPEDTSAPEDEHKTAAPPTSTA